MQKYAIAFGTFDGLHLGHMAVLDRVKSSGFIPLALTFDVPPKMPDKSNLILRPEEKIHLLEQMGIKPILLDFEEIKDKAPLDFLEDVVKKYSPSVISTGFNFRFGKNAAGDKETLESFCRGNGIKYLVSEPVMAGESIVSSTNIRQLISNGDVSTAAKMLGRPFSFEEKIVHGDKRGRTIGFPTINQAYPRELVCPKYGVYSGYTEVGGKTYRSITDIGHRPTFKTEYVIAETYLFDFKGDVYGEKARVHLCDFIRSELKFNTLEELEKALCSDKEKAMLNFKREEIIGKDDYNAKHR